MGDAADDLYDAAMRREHEVSAFWQSVREACEGPTPKPCHLIAIADDDEAADDADLRCTICGKTFFVEV